MPDRALPEVFTPDELARAAGVPGAVVHALVASGELPALQSGRFIALPHAVRVAPSLRARAALLTLPAPRELFEASHARETARRPERTPFLVSSAVHAFVFVTLLMLTPAAPESAPASEPVEPARLVFLVTPGPGGGGGGSGARMTRPATRLERPGRDRVHLSVPDVQDNPVLARTSAEAAPRPASSASAPADEAPEPLPASRIVAPVVVTTVETKERDGVPEPVPDAVPPSAGPGVGGHAGSGAGQGAGAGTGSGIGAGSGGGTGGGPYRPGSGITPPRLLREVKAEYTDEARRRGVRGEVVLEIVVLRDGRVGEITVLRGLPAGLDARAVDAVRRWQFAPATRQGEPVDVIVEVAVEFTVR